MRIAIERPDQPAALALVEALDAYQMPLYPPQSHHGIDLAALVQPNVVFAVARDDAGAAVGCGAVVLGPDVGELKRMYVAPAQRGRGVGRAILDFLEAQAQRRGCTRLMLETGVRQPEALALYERSGYVRRGPFGAYAEDPHSVFMARSLDRRLVEIRAYRLKAGAAGALHAAFAQAVPLLRASGIDVVAWGASPHEPDTYFLVRAFDSLAERQAQEDAFYGSEAWRRGPRESLIACIDSYLDTVLWMAPASVEDLRRSNPSG